MSEDYLATIDKEQGTKWWTKKTVSTKDRMQMNGETEVQMSWAEACKKAGGVTLDPADGCDTSKDQDWEYEEGGEDRYVMLTSALWMLPKLLVFLPCMIILNFIPVLIACLYVYTLPQPLERVPRTYAFYFFFLIAFIFAIPAICLIFLNLILDYTMYYFFSLWYCLVNCRWAQAKSGFEKIAPFRGGPSILAKIPDVFVCVMGQASRQGLWETSYIVSTMWVLMPWLKYYICCNPYIYNLDSRMVQQISTGMKELGTVDKVATKCREIISQAKQRRTMAHRIDLWSFVPHYPYPPSDRRWAIGMQAGGSAYPSKFTLLVHSTHADAERDGSQEQFVLSNSIARPVYRVMLWYSNPFHFLTGWVEASISTGLPSQPKKMHGGEHPMWLVSGHTWLTSSRDSNTGSGLIDWFFDYWLPVFVHEVRFSMTCAKLFAEGMDLQEAKRKALDHANAKYQEVISADGISLACELKGVENYHPDETIAAYLDKCESEVKGTYVLDRGGHDGGGQEAYSCATKMLMADGRDCFEAASDDDGECEEAGME